MKQMMMTPRSQIMAFTRFSLALLGYGFTNLMVFNLLLYPSYKELIIWPKISLFFFAKQIILDLARSCIVIEESYLFVHARNVVDDI